MAIKRFRNRKEAGHLLAKALTAYARRDDVEVLALPRGGVPVAAEIATALDVPLDIMPVRKLGVPGFEELAMGAITRNGTVLNPDVVANWRISKAAIAEAERREMQELERRDKLYRSGRPPPEIHGHTIILVDDGLATGSTMMAAIEGARQAHGARIVVAVPVGAADTCRRLSTLADEIVCLLMPEDFRAVGLWYDDFDQTTDSEVIALLEHAWARHSTPSPPPQASADSPGKAPDR